MPHEDDTRNPKQGELKGHGAQRRELELVERPLVLPGKSTRITRAVTAVLRKKTRGNFARDFLPLVHAHVTNNTLIAMMAWMQAEGDAGRFNPINTTQPEPGSTDFNWVHVQSYLRYWDGVHATAKTLNDGADRDMFGYRAIRKALAENGEPERVLQAVEKSSWGTGGLALTVLHETGGPMLLRDRYLHHRLAQ